MTLGHLGIIGFGSIGRDLLEILGPAPDRVTVLVRPERVADVAAELGDVAQVTGDLSALLATRPDLVVECAGHGAVAEHGPSVLEAGSDLVVASVGALMSGELRARIETAAQSGGAQCVVPAGAIGGIDALGAARLSGLKQVRYTGRKPPAAWAGTQAKDATDLESLNEPFVFFEGNAREAAETYPKNANVAATLALAGLGPEATRVRLIADPTCAENLHEFDITSEALEFSMRLVGKPSPANPKTSRSTVFSIARAVLNRCDAIVI